MSNPTSSPIRIVLVDHLTLVRSGLRAILDRFPQVQVVGEAGTVQEAVPIVRRESPDIILFDSDRLDYQGLEGLPLLIDAAPCVRLVLVTGADDSDFHHRAVELGAMGVVLKTQTVDVLIKAIDKVHQGEAWLDRAPVASVLGRMSIEKTGKVTDPEEAKIATLSKREREIISLAGQGLRNHEIGGRLLISEVTVRHHLSTILSKLDLQDRLELIIYAYQRKLASPPK